MQKTERLVAITLLLQARGKMTAQRLANILGVSIRTIYRDIDTLSLAHVPVSMDFGPGGGYYLPKDYHFDSAIFTREEAVSLVLSADMAGNYNLFADDDGLHRALFKLEAALPEEYRADVRSARERILFDTTAWFGSSTASAYLETIRAAVLSSLQLDILYPCETTGAMQWRSIEPYGLVYKGLSRRHIRTGIWYLVAYCQVTQDFRTFRVGYVEDLRMCEEKIDPHPGFDLEAYWQKARRHLEEHMQPVDVTLRVKSAARFGLRGDSTVLSEEADGSVVVRINVESFDAAISYVLSLGADAMVLYPVRIRDAVAMTAQAIAEKYGAVKK